MPQIWINELHYDNSGTDTGEFIEVAGTAGIDLTGWSLVLYSGADGFAYDTVELSGIIDDQSNGFGTLSYSVGPIQNGPDGIALVDPFGNVVEFISYEGVIQAQDGPAFGLTSTDIGIAETGLDAAGGSIALTGTGNEASDFTWTLVADDTPGAINQTFVPPPTPDYVNLQFPSSTTTITGQTTDLIYGRIFEAGLTEAAGAPANVVAQIGYGPAGTDPTTSGDWVWVDATYNVQVGNDDEYSAALTVPAAGNYSYTFRFAIQDGANPLEYTYADLDGAGTNPGLSFDPSKLGSLTVDWETITGTSGPDTLNGDDNAEIISGLADNDQLHGGGGDDQVLGGDGNDFVVGDEGDDLLEGGLGNDTIWGGLNLWGDTVTYANASGAVQVDLQAGTAAGADGTDSLDGIENVIGSAFGDTLIGSDSLDGTNTLDGGDGDDILDGGEGFNALNGGAGTDTVTYANAGGSMMISLFDGTLSMGATSRNDTVWSIENAIGSAFDDVLMGNDGNNVLNGGLGADSMEGFLGNDQYWVDDVGDIVGENPGAGVDEVRSSITYGLTPNVEDLVLTGSANINGTGNGLANVLTGNSGNNVLNGGGGADTMSGAAGDDSYFVNDAGDTIFEASGAGSDTVRSSIGYSLAANLETLILTGAAAIDGSGNSLNNTIYGNDAANVINGRTGADMMRGGLGDDTYYVDNAGDRVVETSTSGGTDTVRSTVSFLIGKNVENLVLVGSGASDATGNTLANLLTGNAAVNKLIGGDGNDTLKGLGDDDRLFGGAGDDTLYGGLGNDWVEGGAGRDLLDGDDGADTFVFRSGDLGTTTATADRILDFSGVDGDRIRLSFLDANTANGSATNEAFTFIGTASFHHVAGELRCQEINGNTYVFGDTDGDSVADFVIRADGSHTFVAADFLL